MANRIVSVHARIYGMGIYAIMLPSSGFLVAHYQRFHKSTKGRLFLTPLPPSPKCTTTNVDFIVKKLYSQITFMKVSSSFPVICSCNQIFFTK